MSPHRCFVARLRSGIRPSRYGLVQHFEVRFWHHLKYERAGTLERSGGFSGDDIRAIRSR